MNRLDLRTDFYEKINESSTNSSFSTTYANRLLAEGWQAVWSYRNTPWEWLRKDAVLMGAHTTVTSNPAATTINVASASGLYAGQKIYVTDNSIFEEVEISSISGTAITLVSPGLSGTYENGDFIIGESLQLPSDFRNVISVRAEEISGSIQTTIYLKKVTERDIDRIYPRIMSQGTPEFYYTRGTNLFIYPLPDGVWRFHLKYTAKPADLSDTVEAPLPVEYQYLISDFAVAKALSSDVRTKSSNTARVAAYYQSSFANGIQDMLFNYGCKPDSFSGWSKAGDNKPAAFS